MNTRDKESDCPYRKTCHFYNIPDMSPHSENLRERFCIEWPAMCEIYKTKAEGRSAPITLWPHGFIT